MLMDIGTGRPGLAPRRQPSGRMYELRPYAYGRRRRHASRSPSSTTTCSSCAAPSAPSPRWPTSGRTRRSSRCSTTRRAPRGASPGRSVTTSPLQRLGVRQQNFRALLPLFPTAVRRLDLSGFDCVVSSSSAFAHGVRPPAGADARLLLPLAVPLRLARAARARCPRCPRRCGPRWRCCCAATARSTAAPRGRSTATSPTGEITRERIRRFWGRDADDRPPARRRRALPRSASRASTCCSSASWCATSAPRWRSRPRSRPGRRIKVVGDGPGARAPAGPLRRPAPSSSAGWATTQLARLYAEAAALVVPERRGVRHRRGRGAGRRPAGGGGRRRRRARDGGAGPHRACSCRTATRRRSRAPCART